MQILKGLPETVSAREPMLKFLTKQKNMSIASLMCRSEKQWYIHYLLTSQSYKVSTLLNEETQFSDKIVLHFSALE